MADRSDDLERPPSMHLLPILVIGGLALFGALSLVHFVIGTVFAIANLAAIVAVVGAIAFVAVKAYSGPPD